MKELCESLSKLLDLFECMEFQCEINSTVPFKRELPVMFCFARYAICIACNANLNEKFELKTQLAWQRFNWKIFMEEVQLERVQ